MKISVIFNEKSKRVKKSKLIEKINDFFVNKQVIIDYYSFIDKTELKMILNYDTLIVCGGDGTISNVCHNLVVNNLSPKILLVPLGTNNDFSRILRINKKKFCELLSLIEKKEYKDVSLSRLNDKYFLYGSAFGKMANVSYETNRKIIKIFGYLGYVLKCFVELLKINKLFIEINGKNQRYVTCFILKNNILAGFKLKNIHVDDDLVLVALKYKSIFSNLRVFGFFLSRGKIKKKDLFVRFSSLDLCSSIALINLDGELYEGRALNYQTTKKKLSFYQ